MQSISIHTVQTKPQWLTDLAEAFNDPVKLLTFLELNPADFEQAILARKLFPLRVPRSFAERMEKGNPQDPLFLQVMSAEQEFLQVAEFTRDPLEEQHSPAPNILHKYHNRLLFMLKNSCAVNCPKDEELDWLLTQLEVIPHIKTLRIHSRFHVVIPNRITDTFCQRLQASRLNIVLVSHINHANEVDDILAEKLADLKRVGVTLLNQSVLLKGINDNAQILKALSDKLFSVGVLPYYLHLLDKVEGASHFWLPDEQAFEIYQALQKISSGYLVPKLVREIAREPNKTLMG